MRKLLLWLVMVAVMIAAILGGTAAFLYSRTGTDALPQEAVTSATPWAGTPTAPATRWR